MKGTGFYCTALHIGECVKPDTVLQVSAGFGNPGQALWLCAECAQSRKVQAWVGQLVRDGVFHRS